MESDDSLTRNFYPRPPRGGRRHGNYVVTLDVPFLSTPSARRATGLGRVRGYCRIISIHALREEGDHSLTVDGKVGANFYPRPPRGGRLRYKGGTLTIKIFLSTPSARRATLCWMFSLHIPVRFLSTPSARRATSRRLPSPERGPISIHALREEGDGGRALHGIANDISIHALREEGDVLESVR